MTENKLIDNIINALKKTQAFSKFDKSLFYISSLLLFSSIVGASTLYINYSTLYERYDIIDKIEENETELKSEIDNLKSEIDNLKSEIIIIGKYFSQIIENQEEIINQLEEITISNLNKKPQSNNVSASTTIDDEDEIAKYVEHDKVEENKLEENKLEENKVEENKLEENKDNEYDELLNECYDVIPLNNLKKNTGLYWLFK